MSRIERKAILVDNNGKQYNFTIMEEDGVGIEYLDKGISFLELNGTDGVVVELRSFFPYNSFMSISVFQDV